MSNKITLDPFFTNFLEDLPFNPGGNTGVTDTYPADGDEAGHEPPPFECGTTGGTEPGLTTNVYPSDQAEPL